MNNIKDIVNQLKSNNFSSINNALHIIKKHYVRNFHKMQELEKYSALQTIVSLLEHPKFCNTSLSIIADACLQKIWVLKVIKYNGIQSLTRIMKSLVNDDVQHRACRAIANIAKHELDIPPFQTKELVSNVIKFLLETEEVSFKITAIRTLRVLSKDSKCRDIIIHEKGISHIVKLLKSSDKDLVLCCARALAELTENCSVELASQLIKSFESLINLYKQGDAKIKVYVMKYLQNLTAQETVRSDLIKLGVVTLFTNAADDKSLEVAKLAVFGLCNCVDYMHMWANYGTSGLSGLEILVSILKNKNFKDIQLNVINTLRTLSLKQGIVDILIDIGLPFVLIECLRSFIKQHEFVHKEPFLENSTASSSPQKKFKTDTCERHSSNNSYNIINDFTRNVSRTDYLDFHSSGASTYHSSSSWSNSTVSPPYNLVGPHFYTDSDTFPYCWSPVMNSPNDDIMCDELRDFTILPRKTVPKDKATTSRPKAYVPKCGDLFSDHVSSTCRNEETCTLIHNINFVDEPKIFKRNNIHLGSSHLFTNQQTNTLRPTNFPQFYEEKMHRVSVSLGSVDNKESSRKNMDSFILSLLFRLSFRLESKSNSTLANYACFPVLLQYITSIRKHDPKAENVLRLIIKNPHCFEKLITNGFVNELDYYFKIIHDLKSCCHCSNIWTIRENLISAMTDAANTDYGVGTVCHVLCTTSKACRLYTIGAVAKLFHSRSALYKSLIKANGLSLLFQVLSDSTDNMWDKAILYLCEIYRSLEKIRHRKNTKCCISDTCKWEFTPKCFYKDDIHDVSFIVDDGTKINASREKICRNSDYFQALLGGHFKETNENVVKISDISAEVLTTIFHFLHGCYKHAVCCPYITRIPFEVLLELLSESEKYLLFDMKSYVEDRLCHSLSSVNVFKVCEKSKVHNSIILYKKALECALSLDASHQDNSLDCLKLLFKLDSNLGILSDVKNLIQDVLENNEC